MYLGYKYDMGLENGIYHNEFLAHCMVTVRDNFGMAFNYKKPLYNLNNLDDLVYKTTHRQSFFKALKHHQHLSNGTQYDAATREYFDRCFQNGEIPVPSFVKI